MDDMYIAILAVRYLWFRGWPKGNHAVPTNSWNQDSYSSITDLEHVCFEDSDQLPQLSGAAVSGSTIGPATVAPRLTDATATAPNTQSWAVGSGSCDDCRLVDILRNSVGAYMGTVAGTVSLAFRLHDSPQGRGHVENWWIEMEFVGGDHAKLAEWRAREEVRREALERELAEGWCSDDTIATTSSSTGDDARPWHSLAWLTIVDSH